MTKAFREAPNIKIETRSVFENLPAEIKNAQPQSIPSVEFQSLLDAALNQPLFYPPINQWLFPGDSLAILLQSNLPNPIDVINSLIKVLKPLEIDLNDVVVVITSQMAEQFGITAEQQQQSESEIANGMPPALIQVAVGEGGGEEISFQVHDPSNSYGLSYLAANEAGDPVHVNKLLADADVVLPIGCPTPGDQQRYDCLYPDFGSEARFEQFKIGAGSINQRTQEIELANDNLGTFFALQIISSPGGEVAAIVSGAKKDAIDHAKRTADEIWAVKYLPDCQAVLATMEERGRKQTWDDFADAVINASNISNGSGPIVVWSSIDQPADRNTRKALMSQFDDSISGKFSVQQRSLASIISDRPIFLHSQLSQSQTEELGLGYIDTEQDALRILAKFESGVLLRDAHRCRIQHPSPASN